MGREMSYGHLGRSGLLVSWIGLGTMNFGCTVDEPESFAVMDAAVDAGITFFDTADVYGGAQSPDMKKGYGIAEETVGRGLQRSGCRELRADLDGSAVQLDTEVLERLDRIWPGLGEAPQLYAS
jgi:aryl-alcohol dehydrogenase-like predicted oxidoreductase